MRSLDIAGTGLSAQQIHVDVISHNLANMTTTGYKAQRPEFQDLIYQDLKRAGTNASSQGGIIPVGVQIGLGVKNSAISREFSQGTVQSTEAPLDIAFQGKGFFTVQLPDGTDAYTRDGAFKISENGIIVSRDGYPLQPNITIPDDATNISINSSGEVEATIQGQIQPQLLGQIQATTFINPTGLQAIGDNLYLESQASGTPINGIAGEQGVGTVLQGYLESSNVNPVTAITDLIVAQRAYEMNTKVIKASDEMLQSLNQSV